MRDWWSRWWLLLAVIGVVTVTVLGGVMLRTYQCRHAQNKFACFTADKVIYVAP